MNLSLVIANFVSSNSANPCCLILFACLNVEQLLLLSNCSVMLKPVLVEHELFLLVSSEMMVVCRKISS